MKDCTSTGNCHDFDDVRTAAHRLLKYDSAADGQFTRYEFQLTTEAPKRVAAGWLRTLVEDGELLEEYAGTFYRGTLRAGDITNMRTEQ